MVTLYIMRSSSLDAPITATNASVKPFSTQGSANLQARQLDNEAVFVQRSTTRLFKVGFGQDVNSIDYNSMELTMLVPQLLEAGVVSFAIQRQPDTRIHCVLANARQTIWSRLLHMVYKKGSPSQNG